MVVGCTWLGLAAGCSSDFDTGRRPRGEQSFGATVVELACKRMAHLHDLADGDGRVDVSGSRYRAVCRGEEEAPANAPDHLRALLERRDTLRLAIDSAAPASDLPALQAWLTSEGFLALYDDGTTTAAVDALVAGLRFAAGDAERGPALHEALVRLDGRPGYRPPRGHAGADGGSDRVPALHEALGALTGAIAAGGSAEQEWHALIAAVAASMRHAAEAPDPTDAERTANLALGLLFRTDPSLGSSVAPDPALGALMRDIEDTAASPLAGAMVAFGAALARDAEVRAPVEGTLACMLDQSANRAGFVHGLVAVADLLQMAVSDQRNMTPVARALGEMTRPERGWVAPIVRFLHGASRSDTSGALAGLLRNLFTPHRAGDTALSQISDSLAEVHRARPFNELGHTFAVDDYQAMLRGMADFMDEERRGLRKFIAIVKGRKL